MPIQSKYHASFYEGGIYHVYNRTNNRERLFKSDANRIYFLKQYARYIHPFAETFCWCLLPNHFHFLIRIRQLDTIKTYLQQQEHPLKSAERKFLTGHCNTDQLLILEWQRFFTAYSMAFNKQHNRNGNLFQRPFKRLEVNKESHFTQAVIYIHANAQRHNLCTDFTEYKWTSWHSMLSANETMLNRTEVLDWFGGQEQFIKAHQNMAAHYCNSDDVVDDD